MHNEFKKNVLNENPDEGTDYLDVNQDIFRLDMKSRPFSEYLRSIFYS